MLVRRAPVGVAVGIIPWNVPRFISALKRGPAMAAGCPIVLKPAPETPLDAYLLAEAVIEADLPPGVTGADIGTLVHAVMEKLDFEQPGAVVEITRAVALSSGLPEEAAEKAAAPIEDALKSPVLERARGAARVWRELPFCLARDGATIEGKMDLVFEEKDGLVIVDYKTNLIEAGGTAALREKYRGQAGAYGLALAAVTDRPVKEVVLLFMRGPKEEPIPVDADPESVESGLAALIRAG